MTQADIPRKVGQLGDDVYELYGLLNKISNTQAEHGATLADFHTSMKDVRLAQLQQRARLNQIEDRLASQVPVDLLRTSDDRGGTGVVGRSGPR